MRCSEPTGRKRVNGTQHEGGGSRLYDIIWYLTGGLTIRLNQTERYTSIDDRRPAWARDGKLPVAYRRLNLRLELARHGIASYKSPDVSKKLGDCSLTELRKIHANAVGGVQGSVNARLEEASGDGTLVDAHNATRTASIAKGESFLSLDFRPYNMHHDNGHSTAATYFLFKDLGLAIDALRDSGAENPKLIATSTNRTMARLAVRRAGFALYGARVESGNHLFEFGEQPAARIIAGGEDSVLQAAGADIELNIFMNTSDFLSEDTRTDYAQKAAFIQERLALPSESPDQTEARLRAEAIQLSLLEMRATDALRLARHSYRRDIIEPAGNISFTPAQQQIAAWQPRIEPEGFVLPDYYAK